MIPRVVCRLHLPRERAVGEGSQQECTECIELRLVGGSGTGDIGTIRQRRVEREIAGAIARALLMLQNQTAVIAEGQAVGTHLPQSRRLQEVRVVLPTICIGRIGEVGVSSDADERQAG